MYALFKDNKFVELVLAIDKWKYQTDKEFTLYKCNTIDNNWLAYDYILSHDFQLVCIPKEWYSKSAYFQLMDDYKENIKKQEKSICFSLKNKTFLQRLKYLFTKVIL